MRLAWWAMHGTPASGRKTTAPDTSEAVDQFMAKLEHPHKDAVETIRRIMCGADAAMTDFDSLQAVAETYLPA